MSLFNRLESSAQAFRTDLKVYQLALKDRRVPRLAKWLIGLAVAYAFTPVDLIPDFIPVIGHLDDVIIVPALIFIALKMIPPNVIVDCRKRVSESS